jgi:hypothetical protein
MSNDDDVLTGNPKAFRFKAHKNISINPPSSVLHISNLVGEACNETLLRILFSQYGRVETIKYIY